MNDVVHVSKTTNPNHLFVKTSLIVAILTELGTTVFMRKSPVDKK